MKTAHAPTRLARPGLVALLGWILIGAPASGAATPLFDSGFNVLGLANVGSRAAPSLVDLDADGDLDALVGEAGGDLTYWENIGSATEPTYASGVANPFGLTAAGLQPRPTWVDIDADGDQDLFVGVNATSPILFYENIGSPATPSFAAPVTNAFGLSVSTSAATITFGDIDADADFDALVGDGNGDFFFVENTGTKVAPALAPPVLNPFGLVNLFFEITPRWADFDDDGDLDILMGRTDGEFRLYENTGTFAVPVYTYMADNPFGLADVGNFAKLAAGDLDDDGALDLLVGNGNGDTTVFWNIGTPAVADFVGPHFAPFGLSDILRQARPAFGDFDADGDLDAFYSSFLGDFLYFENVGSAATPAFASPVTNPFGLQVIGFASFSPTAGDLDDDGDIDLLVGRSNGQSFYVENLGTTTVPAFGAGIPNPFGITDVGDDAAPELADLDDDGDLDALLGTRGGGGSNDTEYFENIGTPAAPSFAAAQTNPFGLVPVSWSSGTPELADVDADGDLDLFMGNSEGETDFFENTGSAAAPSFAAPVEHPFGIVRVISRAAPTLVDIDADGDLDGFWGNLTGQTLFLENVSLQCPPTPVPTCTTGFEKGQLLVNAKKPGNEKLIAKLLKGPATVQSDLGNPTLPAGTRNALCIYDDGGSLAAELAVQRSGDTCGTKPYWKSIGGAPPTGKGFVYKDKAAASSGVTTIVSKTGDTGKTKVILKAGNNAKKLQASLPTDIIASLGGTISVDLQYIDSDGGCLGITLTETTKVGSILFRAK